jgi:hypothetical protein
LLKRESIVLNHKRLRRIYREESYRCGHGRDGAFDWFAGMSRPHRRRSTKNGGLISWPII